MPGDTLLFFASLCLFLSSVEYAVPKPLPFMRLGLANLPVIFAVTSFRARDVLLLVLLKVLLSSFISGTMFSYVFLFSAAGSFASGLAVYCLYALLRKCGGDRLISNAGLCLLGALANNAAQIAVARVLIFGRQAYVIAPLLLASGLISGLALGLFANGFEKQSCFLKAVREGRLRKPLAGSPAGGTGGAGMAGGRIGGAEKAGGEADSAEADSSAGKAAGAGTARTPLALAVVAFVLMLALPFTGAGFAATDPRGLWIKAAVWLLLLVLDEAARKGKVRLLPPLIMIASLAALSLLSPSGKVLHVIGSFRITRGALEAGLSKGLTLTGMLFASQVIFSALQGRGLGRVPASATSTGGGNVTATGRGNGAKCSLPGLAGSVFADFARLSGRGLDIKGKGLMAALDGRLCELWPETDFSGEAVSKVQTDF